MQRPDRFLLGIIIGTILMVGVGLAVAFSQPAATYRTEDAPEAIAHNYLLALHQRDYARAYGYLAPTMQAYPDETGFRAYVSRDYSTANVADNSISIETLPARVNETNATVEAKVNRFYAGGLFDGGNTYTDNVRMELAQDEDGAWKILASDDFWNECWNDPNVAYCS